LGVVVAPRCAIELPAATPEILGKRLRLFVQLIGTSQFLEQGAAGTARYEVRGHS
jgi:hypothetical protein